MMTLTKKQADLLAVVAENPNRNTHQLAQTLGHYQAYESYLRNRLFRLAARGVLSYEETRGPHGTVCERRWRLSLT